MEGCSRWGLSNLRNLTENSPDQSLIQHCDLIFVFLSALRIFLPLCERHFTINDMNQLTANYLRLTKPTGSLPLSKRIISVHPLTHERFRLSLY